MFCPYYQFIIVESFIAESYDIRITSEMLLKKCRGYTVSVFFHYE